MKRRMKPLGVRLAVFFLMSLLPLGFLVEFSWSTSAFGQAGEKGRDEKNDLVDPAELMKRLLEVNRVWLDPAPADLSYTLELVWHREGGDKEQRQRVRADKTNRARLDSRGPDDHEAHTAVFTPSREYHVLTRYHVLSQAEAQSLKSIPRGDTRFLYQGISWCTAMHALYAGPEAVKPRILERRTAGAGEIVVLEVDLERRRGWAELGLRSEWMRGMIFNYFSPGKVRIHVRLPDCVPIREEYLAEDGRPCCRAEYGPDFISFGEQRAPARIRSVPRSIDATFQKVEDNWLFKQGEMRRGEELVASCRTLEVSTASIEPEIFEEPIELFADKPAPRRLSDLSDGETSRIELISDGCFHFRRHVFEFAGGSPIAAKVLENRNPVSHADMTLTPGEVADLDTALEYYRNAYPLRWTHAYLFKIDWYDGSRLLDSEQFSACALCYMPDISFGFLPLVSRAEEAAATGGR